MLVLLLGAAPAAARESITVEDVERLFPAARSALAVAGFDTQALDAVVLEVVDLEDTRVGEAAGPVVRLDPDAAGVGWFVDPTPWIPEEFGPSRMGVARATAGEPADRVDLWSTLVHELGHVVGLDHEYAGFMAATLVRGERWSPLRWERGQQVD